MVPRCKRSFQATGNETKAYNYTTPYITNQVYPQTFYIREHGGCIYLQKFV